MASRKCWSRTVGAHRGTRVRVYERRPAGPIYLAVWLPGRGASRKSLGHKDREKALRQARKIADLRLTGDYDDAKSLTLGVMLDRYLTECRYNRDGSLKTERYRKNCATFARNLKHWFGVTTPVDQLTPDRMEGYVCARRAGRITGKPVGTRSIQIELSFLKSAMKWISGVFEHGQPLLRHNPLVSYSPPRERDPRRPMIDGQTVEALLRVAPRVHPFLPLLIALMDTTGRRLSSVLGLRWDDFAFERKTIRWRPELDKRRRTWVTPMPVLAESALLECRNGRPAIGTALVFPAMKNPDKPVSKYLASAWLRRAYELAGVARESGGLWHPFRRKWATERKKYPLPDVAAAGGWSDTQTLLTCYQRPDAETLRVVVDGPIGKAASS